MKMSKWFHEKTTLCGDTIEDSEFSYAVMSCEYLIDGVDAGDAICHAINNHDRMVDEIAELKLSIEKINLACVSNYGHGVGKILNDEDGKSLCKLLDKLNQEGEG